MPMAMTEASASARTGSYEEKAIQLAQLAKALNLEVTGVAAPSPHDPKKYEHLAEVLNTRFRAAVPDQRFHSAGVAHGFYVAARLAMWGVRAYEEFTRVERKESTVDEVQTLLRDSYDPAVTTFSSVGNERNKALEQAFGLDSNYMPGYEPLPFAFLPDSRTGFPVLTPSPGSLILVKGQLEYQIEPELSNGSGGRCPASGGMLKNIWRATIDACGENQDFFPFDVDQMNARSV